MLKNKFLAATILSTMLLPFSSVAANVQPGVIDKPAPEIKLPESRVLDKKPGKPLEAAPTQEKVVGGNQLVATINKINFSGASVISEEELQEAAASYLDRKLTKQDVANLKYDITKLFYDRGYVLVKVTTPPQDLSKGVMEIKIYEAKIGDISIETNGVVHPFVVEGITKRLSRGDIFRESSVESMVSDANDLSNATASVVLHPGKEFGYTDLDLSVTEASEAKNHFSLDNYGSPLTGEVVGTLYLERNNVFNLGENWHTTMRRSDGHLTSVAAGTELPTGLYNLKFKLDALHSENAIGDRLKALQASGDTDTLTASFTSTVLNTRNEKVTVEVGLDNRTHESTNDRGPGHEFRDAKDDIRQAFVDTSYLTRNSYGLFYGDARLVRGIDALGANKKGDADATNVNADPEALIFMPTLYTNLYSPFSDGNFKASFTAQLASNQLLSSDLFILGGYGNVRGFDPAEEVGDTGWRYSVQYDHNLPELSGERYEVKAGPFIEGGHVNLRGPVKPLDSSLHSAGFGIELVADLIETGPTKFRVDWAHPLGDYTSPEVSDNTFYFRVTQEF